MSSAHGEQSEILSTSAAQSVRLVALSSTNTRRNGQVDALARGINRSLSQRERERESGRANELVLSAVAYKASEWRHSLTRSDFYIVPIFLPMAAILWQYSDKSVCPKTTQ